MVVSEEHSNNMGYLHGGMSASLIDSLTSAALRSAVDKEFSSVSVEMNLTLVLLFPLHSNMNINVIIMYKYLH